MYVRIMPNKNQMRWGVEVIGWLNFYVFVYSVHVRWLNVRKNQVIESMYFFFWFTACTSIIFFFCIVIIYVLSLLFFVYRVHINHFFLLYCKNLCTLQCTHQLFFFFSIIKSIYFLCFLFTHQSFFCSIKIYVLFCLCLQRAL